MLDKVCRIGTQKSFGGRYFSTFIHIKWNGSRLSICGVEGPTPAGNCLGACGQIDMHPWNIVNYAPGWGPAKVKKLKGVWKEWHLNDLSHKQVPPEVIKWLESLPDTDRKPAWV